MSLSTILQALGNHGLRISGNQRWAARCPAHDDRNPSLSIAGGEEGKVVVHCHAGCNTTAVMAALNLSMAELFAEKREERSGGSDISDRYEYRDEKGALLFEVTRLVPKSFRQRRPDPAGGWIWGIEGVRRVLYRLPELVKASSDLPVFIVEGEKDVDNVRALHRNIVATCNVGGAGRGKWRSDYSECLRGRDVVILPDNDDPGREHAKIVADALTDIARSVHIVELPGLSDKGDVSDWIAAGGTAEQLFRLAREAQSATPAVSTFQNSAERLIGEREGRIAAGQRALSFGVKYLDDAMGGIMPNDLILLGAKSGVGKTALATMIALHNCSVGKRVHYFALEAEELEIERRMKFQVLASEYYRLRYTPGSIRYLDWAMGRIDQVVGHHEDRAEEILRERMANLQTFYRFNSFTGDDFCQRLDAIKDETDLVVLDHLHYVDHEGDNENQAFKQTVKKIRDSALRIGKPVLVIAHVRKSDRRYDTPVPSLEDFHGTSDIPKISTKAIMLAPATDVEGARSYLLPTYMQVVKCRPDASVTRFTGLVTFNARENKYEPEYSIGRFVDNTFQVLPLDNQPAWARAKRYDE